jgi:ACS family glucarate transporter-like MFS transporter
MRAKDIVFQVKQAQSGSLRWLLVFWMFLISSVAYLDRVNISIAGPAIAREFHIDNVQLGWVLSAFLVGYALFQTPGGALADRAGPRRIIALGVVWWAVFTSLITVLSPGTANLLILLLLTRFCLGVGEAVVYPSCNAMVAAWIPSRERGKANGAIFAGVGLGGAFTSPFISYVTVNFGWRSCFLISAVLGLVVGGIWYLIARDKPEQHPKIGQGELELIKAGLPGGKTAKGPSLPWSYILTEPNILAVTFSYFAYGYAAYIFISWFFIYLNTVRKMNVKQSAAYTVLPFLAMAVGSIVGGWISDALMKRYGKRVGRCYVAAGAIALAAVFITFGSQLESASAASFVLAGGAGALYLSQSAFWTISADFGKQSAGSVSGFMNMVNQFGGALTASLTPWIAKNYGWTASFLVAAGLCLAGAAAWLFVHPERADQKVPATA